MSLQREFNDEGIRSYLEAWRLMMDTTNRKAPKGWFYRSPNDLLLQEGREFAPAKLPNGMRKHRLGECFRNAALLAISRKDLIYCEGIAAPAKLYFPMEHAWCCTREGVVIDPTWDVGGAYWGVAIKKGFVSRMLARNGYYGIISQWERGYFMGKFPATVWKEELT